MSGKHVLIGGGTGFIGTRLQQILTQNQYKVTVISRMPGLNRITWHDLEKGLPSTVTSIVNLAGQNVLDPTRRWTPGFSQNVRNSRINSTATLVKSLQNSCVESFINISGVSLYRPDSNIHTEEEKGESFDFMSKLCIEWEKAASIPLFKEIKTRGVKIRTGVVVGRGGGMIKSIYLPFFLGLGGPIGKGSQYLPWIHIDDLCSLIKYAIENENVEGVLNGVAPEIVTNLQFSKAFASSLHRPALIPLPEFVVNAIFGKERSVLLLTGPKIKPKKTLELGFEYQYPTAKSACDEIVKSK